MRILLIEDRPSMRETLTHRLERCGGVALTWAPHYKFATDRRAANGQRDTRAAELLAGTDLVIIDAFDRDQTQEHPDRSGLRCLDVLRIIRGVPPEHRPRVAAYSTAMREPEVHVTLHCTDLIAGCYTPDRLIEDLPALLRDEPTLAEPVPTPQDWKRIHPDLRPGADLADLHERMEANERAWRLVTNRNAPFDQAAQKWISRQILPWLTDNPHPSYRLAVDVTRRIAGLAYPTTE